MLSPIELQDALWERMNSLKHIITGRSHVSMPDSKALHMMPTYAKGWGERHPMARRMAKPGLVMVFGPRDKAELEIVWEIVQRSYTNAATPQ